MLTTVRDPRVVLVALCSPLVLYQAGTSSSPGEAVTLSNTQLPVDQFNNTLVTGEADILVHPADGHYYFYFNNWGNCTGIDCCASEVGCRDCCYFVGQPGYPQATCVETNNHSVVVYRTRDFSNWQFLGEALPASARPNPQIEYRPHVVWNAKTQLFVMWYNRFSMSDEVRFKYAVAISKTAAGPFEVTSTDVATHGGVKVGDFDILVDGDSAYLVHGDTNMAVEQLDNTFTKTTNRVTRLQIPSDPHGRGSEGPVFFQRAGVYYILPGTGCCGCLGGSNIYVFTAKHPMGPYQYQGDVGSNITAPWDPHSPWNYPTRAQASAAVDIGSDQILWMGNQWVTSKAPGQPRNSDLLYFWPLEFTSDGNISQVRYERTVQISI